MRRKDEIDDMIANAKRMGRQKPFERERIQPDRPSPAAADDTRVARKNTKRRGIADMIRRRL